MSKAEPPQQTSPYSEVLSVLNKIGQTLITAKHPLKALGQIAIDAKEILKADLVDLYEYNQATNKFVLPPILVGERRNLFIPKDEINDNDVVIQVIKTRKPQYYSDAQKTAILTGNAIHDQGPEKRFVIREEIVSSASFPLLVDDEKVGVMFINYRTYQNFEDDQKYLMDAFANLAAMTIQRVRVWYQESYRQVNSLTKIIDSIGAKEQLSIIIEEVVTLFDADYGAINRLTDDGQYLEAPWRFIANKPQPEPEIRKNESRSIDSGIIGHVVKTGKTFRTGAVNKVPFYDAWFPNTASEMAIPLTSAFGNVIGVLNLESNQSDFFTEYDEKLAERFANAVSAAIEQAELFEAIQSLHHLTETRTLTELLDQILKNINKIIGQNVAASINLYDEDNDDFHSFYCVSTNLEFARNYLLASPRPNGTRWYVIQEKRAIFYDDIKNIPDSFPKLRPGAIEQNIVSFAALPLIYQNKIVGVLFIHKMIDRTYFNDTAQQLLQTYAIQAALAIHNAQNSIGISLLKEILDTTVSQSRQKVLDLIVEKVTQVVDSDYSSVWIGKTKDLIREAIYVKPNEEQYFDKQKNTIKSDQGSTNMLVYQSGKPIILNDVTEKEKTGHYKRSYQKARSEIAAPLIFHGEIIGTINAESQIPYAYSDLDAKTLKIFADVAVMVLKVAQDREEIQKQAKDLSQSNQELAKRGEELDIMNYRIRRRNASFEALTEISQQLTASIDRGEREILSIIHQQASRIIDTQNMYIALYEPTKDEVHFELAFLDGQAIDIANNKDWQPRVGGNGRTEWIIRNKKPILTLTKADAEEWYRQPDSKDYIGKKFASWLGVPILFGDEVMGVIATYHETEDYKYAPDNQEILALMGRHAAIALKNARLVRQLDKRIIALDTIRELGEDLSKGALFS